MGRNAGVRHSAFPCFRISSAAQCAKLMFRVISTENKGMKVTQWLIDFRGAVTVWGVYFCVDRQELHCNSRYPSRR